MFQQIIWQPPGRRKAEEFVIYKPFESGEIQIQSDKSIARIDPNTKKLVGNFKGSNAKYGIHLTEGLFELTKMECPPELLKEVLDNAPKQGDKIAEGIYWG